MEFCPICYEHISRDCGYRLGDVLICGGCELPLIVTSVLPLVFKPAYAFENEQDEALESTICASSVSMRI
jgi:hypothetical protein